MQGRLCDLLLTGCGLELFSFFLLYCACLWALKHIPHTFLSSKLQEHVEVQLRIGAADGFVLIKRTHSYKRKWEKKVFSNRKKPQTQTQKVHKRLAKRDLWIRESQLETNLYPHLFHMEVVNRRGYLDSPSNIWKHSNLQKRQRQAMQIPVVAGFGAT